MTTQVIAYTQRLDFKTLLDIECKSLTGFAPIVKDSMDELQSILSLFPDINILIIDQPDVSPDYEFLMNALEERQGSIKNIFFISNQQITLENSKTFELDKIELFMVQLKKILSPGDVKVGGYISVPADSLIHFKILPFDLFIKISEEKYIKRIPANEDIDEETVNNFRAKGITELHFERKYNRDFSLMLLNNMINKVEGDYSTIDEKLKARNEVFMTTKEIVQSVGLPPRVIQVCESVMEKIAEDVTKEKDRFSNYLGQIKKQSSLNFQFRFVELTSFIVTQIIDDLNHEDKSDQIKKAVFASFFCDISLTDPSQLHYRTADSIKELFPEDKKVIDEHALKAAGIVIKYKNAPTDVDIIIKEHHGSPSGIGFSETAASLHPLSKCLMASQEIAMAILKDPETPAKDLIRNLMASFEHSAIHEYLVRFEQSCKANL